MRGGLALARDEKNRHFWRVTGTARVLIVWREGLIAQSGENAVLMLWKKIGIARTKKGANCHDWTRSQESRRNATQGDSVHSDSTRHCRGTCGLWMRAANIVENRFDE